MNYGRPGAVVNRRDCIFPRELAVRARRVEAAAIAAFDDQVSVASTTSVPQL
jgi:hypothetical protein